MLLLANFLITSSVVIGTQVNSTLSIISLIKFENIVLLGVPDNTKYESIIFEKSRYKYVYDSIFSLSCNSILIKFPVTKSLLPIVFSFACFPIRANNSLSLSLINSII